MCVVCPSVLYFYAFSHERKDIPKKKLLKMCILIVSITFIQNISHSKKYS